jgi:hypothetical protein
LIKVESNAGKALTDEQEGERNAEDGSKRALAVVKRHA